MKQYIRHDTYTSKPNEWKLYNDVEDNNFTSLVDIIIESNQPFNILGAAGCSKSTLIKMIQRKLTVIMIKTLLHYAQLIKQPLLFLML
jgi:ABC-type nitrate/sulfonate/bicarbonate transport system ATPase subunit